VEFLVTMTTRVPEGTAQQAVDDIRAREAVHSRELAAAGYLLRLWRPPLGPGEWRTLGLFAAADATELETVLTSMPLRVWRTDEVTPLSPHPNDPAVGWPAVGPAVTEFHTTFTITIPEGTPRESADDAFAREARRAGELAAEGHLIRLWRLPSEGDATMVLGLWAARDLDEMREIVASLPLDSLGFMTTRVTPLSPHPSDPAGAGGRHP
jgi:muconolactone delta-isomerase